MTTNPHHEAALQHKDDAWYDENGGSSDLAKAKLEATLALAYEQRTANLIAFYGDGPAGGQWDESYSELHRQITERLGLV